MTPAASQSSTLRRQPGRIVGKDELNLADWRISLPRHQQPRKADGGKLDFIEYRRRTFRTSTAHVVFAFRGQLATNEDVLQALHEIRREIAEDTAGEG